MDNSESAFPWDDKNGDGSHYHAHSGLTKREYFAALAMSALLTNYRDHAENGFKQADFPHFAVIMADALLAELEKSNG